MKTIGLILTITGILVIVFEGLGIKIHWLSTNDGESNYLIPGGALVLGLILMLIRRKPVSIKDQFPELKEIEKASSDQGDITQ